MDIRSLLRKEPEELLPNGTGSVRNRRHVLSSYVRKVGSEEWVEANVFKSLRSSGDAVGDPGLYRRKIRKHTSGLHHGSKLERNFQGRLDGHNHKYNVRVTCIREISRSNSHFRGDSSTPPWRSAEDSYRGTVVRREIRE